MEDKKVTTLWECEICKWYGSDPELAIVYLTLENEYVVILCPKCGYEVKKCL